MAKTLFILNDPPYGTERSYNALRLAGSLSKREGEEVKVFLIGDAAACAKSHQKVPQGFYNLELMLKAPGRHGAEIGVCWYVHGRAPTSRTPTWPKARSAARSRSSPTGRSGQKRRWCSDE